MHQCEYFMEVQGMNVQLHEMLVASVMIWVGFVIYWPMGLFIALQVQIHAKIDDVRSVCPFCQTGQTICSRLSYNLPV